MKKNTKKSFYLILAFTFVVAVVITAAIILMKQENEKGNQIEKINLQSYAGNNILSANAFDNGIICQLFNSYNPTDNDSDFNEGLFSALIYDLSNNSSLFFPLSSPRQRSIIGNNGESEKESFSYLYENVALTGENVLFSFTVAHYIENGKSDTRELTSFDPRVFVYSLDGEFLNDFSLKECEDIDAVLVPNKDAFFADDKYIYTISCAYRNISSSETNREQRIEDEQFEYYFVVYDYKGQVIYERKVSENASLIKSSGEGILLLEDKKVIAITGDEEEILKGINSIDKIIQSGNPRFNMIFLKGNSIYGYSSENEKTKKLLKVKSEKLGIFMIEKAYYFDGNLYCAYNEGNVTSDTLLVLKKGQAKKKDKGDKRIVIGTTNPYFSLGELTTVFRNNNSEYQVEIREYESEEKLLEAIIKKEQIDLVDLSSVDSKVLEEKGLLEDLYVYIDSDKELNREDFNKGVMDLFESNGCLYEAFPGYFPITMIANKQMINQEWDYDKLVGIIEDNPEDYYREEILNYSFLRYRGKILSIDYNGSECDFTYPQFLIEFEKTKKYPSYEQLFKNAEEIDLISLLEKRGSVETSLNIYDLAFLSYYNDNNNQDIIIAGYPMEDGNYSFYGEAIQVGILSSSKQKNLAWEYIRPYFTSEFQTIECYRNGFFPTRKDVLNILNEIICLKSEKEVQYVGVLQEYSGNRALDYTYNDIQWGPADIVKVQKYEEELSHAKKYPSKDRIQSILLEEAESFWEGNKTAQDCLKVVNSRVKIFLEERK